MKRYLLFGGDHLFHPAGGMDDFLGGFSDINDARAQIAEIESGHSGWWQLLDIETGAIITTQRCLAEMSASQPDRQTFS